VEEELEGGPESPAAGVEVASVCVELGGASGPELVLRLTSPWGRGLGAGFAGLGGVPGEEEEGSVEVAGEVRYGIWSKADREGSEWRFAGMTPALTHEDAGSREDVVDVSLELTGLSPYTGPAAVQGKLAAPSPEGVMLRGEIHCLRELLGLEPECKWVLYTLAMLFARIEWPRKFREPLTKQLVAADPCRARSAPSLDSSRPWPAFACCRSVCGAVDWGGGC